MLVSRRKVPSAGTKMAPPPKEDGKRVCPIGECREAATHPLDDCKGFGDLSVTKRRKVLKEWGLCECCLTNCKDEETGTWCGQRVGFQRHWLLRLAVQQEVIRADRAKWKGDQSQNRAMGRDQQPKGAPPEKIRRLNSSEQNRNKG